MALGSLRKFCESENFSIKSYESAAALKNAMEDYDEECKLRNGVLWFVRRDQKPKDVLRHLRNAFAHGHFSKRQKNRQECLDIQCIDKGTLKARGFIPFTTMKRVVDAARACEC